MKKTALRPRSKKPRYDREEMFRNFRARWELVGRSCENCGRPIPEPAPANFAHKNGRNVSTRSEIESGFFVVCETLHRYEHSLAANLAADVCVARHLDRLERRRRLDPNAPFWPESLPRSPRAD
jgi:hypothetical protein